MNEIASVTPINTKIVNPVAPQTLDTSKVALALKAPTPPPPKDPIEKLIILFTKKIATFQTNIYRIMWGSPQNPPQRSVVRDPLTGELAVVKQEPKVGVGKKVTNFLESGIFNILDTINALDLCNILTFLTNTANNKPQPKAKDPTPRQKALYSVQERAKEVQTTIDKYTALPSVLVKSYAGLEPQVVTPKQAVTGSGAPVDKKTIEGSDVQKYNMYALLQDLKDILSAGGEKSFLTKEEGTLISQVPGLGNSLNFIDDFTGYINQYTDYRNIDNKELQKLQNKINQVRSVCVTIQTLNLKSALALAGNFLGVDVRAQIQKLSQVVDPVKLLPTLKQIANTVNSIVKIAKQVYNVVTQMQFIIKIAILFIKVFTFIEVFFISLPLPNVFTLSGVQTAFGKARDAASTKRQGLIKRLEQVNSLLAVILSFVRYLLATTTELLVQLEILIKQLEACEAMKDSAVLQDLRASYKDLKQVQEQLAAYVLNYDGKTNPDSTLFGVYSIRVVDEELTDRSITNKRRRGIALDANGALIVQSDLTFATNTTIIIQEVKLKLISQGLVAPQLSTLNASDLDVISTSVDYLEDNTILGDDFNLENLASENVDPPDGTDETQGLGLNAFINNLKGGKRLRKRVKAALEKSSTQFKAKMAQEKTSAGNALNTDKVSNSVGNGSNVDAGNLTTEDRKKYLLIYKQGPIKGGINNWANARKKLEEDEAAGGPGRKADPNTGLA